jgi:hypothetical protein
VPDVNLEERVKALVPKIGFGWLAFGTVLLIVGVLALPFLLATVPVLGLTVFAAAWLPLKWVLCRLFSPKVVNVIMCGAAIWLLLPHAITWSQGIHHQLFPHAETPKVSSTAQAQPRVTETRGFRPWYTQRKNCHLFGLQGDTGQSFANRGVCLLKETDELYCQCADYDSSGEASLDHRHTCSIVEAANGKRQERARFNRLDQPICEALAARVAAQCECH